MEFDAAAGAFDYIICHGVYSWVPPAVQEKILAICTAHLAPAGIAYVSYNTYPGWHIRGMIRDMLGYHLPRLRDPRERIREARSFVDMVAAAVTSIDSVCGKLLEGEAERLRQSPDTYLFHEHLERENHPVYFHEFASRCAATACNSSPNPGCRTWASAGFPMPSEVPSAPCRRADRTGAVS